MHGRRKQLLYLTSAGAVVVLGLGSRRFANALPAFLAAYAGDTLWALMVFLGVSALAPRARAWKRAAIALVAAYAVEISQLYHAPWIDSLRRTTLGGLVLGFEFVWSDLLCYTTGVLLGVALESVASRTASASGRTSA